MYHFLDLTPAEAQTRRTHLDHAAQVAQLSVLAPLGAAVLIRAIAAAARRWGAKDRGTATATAKSKLKGGAQAWWGWEVWRGWGRRAEWYGRGQVRVAGWRVGNRVEVGLALWWGGWLVGVAFGRTGEDYLHLTKQFGIVGASQLPFHYLLSLKSPYSPLHLLLGTSHESLITTHQLLGHIITALFWAHVVLYFNFYILKGLLLAKLQYLFIICGVVAIIAFTAIGTTALRPLRDWSYRVFYITHVTLATALLPILWLHVEHIQPFIYETAAIYAVSVALRWVSTNSHTATITKLPGTNLVEIVVPMAKDGAVWQPGQHAYVSVASHPLLRTFRSNPFTVASIPANDKHLRFVVRLMDGSTAKLAHAGAQTQKVMVEGPYGLATHAERLLGCDRVLLVAGGVGATFIVPLYRQLLADLSPSRGSYRRQKVRFVWAARKRADVEWAVPAAGAEKDSFCERLSVYVTGEGGEASASASASSGVGMRRGLATADEGDDDGNVTGEDGIELEERKTLLAEDEAGREGESGSLSVMAGRPDVGACIDEVFSHGRSERVAVVVCGPYSLSHRVRTEVAGWVGRGRDVWFWDERFAT